MSSLPAKDDAPVRDRLQRPLRDLRISLTDLCNLRCTYCMPKELFGSGHLFLRKDEWLRFSEIDRIVEALVRLGLQKVRLTGGEPLLRPGLPKLIRGLRRFPEIGDLALTTNGLRLAERVHELVDAGLQRVTVSLDALDPALAGRINGYGIGPAAVIAGVDAALGAGLRVKLNTVVERGVNESEIIPIARFAKERGVEARFIEFMDVGNTNGWKHERVVSGADILARLRTVFALDAVDLSSAAQVAKTYRHRDDAINIGLITSVTQPFCGDCSRLRLSADGKLFTCLFASSGFDLRKLLRETAPDAEALVERLGALWGARTDRYSELRSAHPPEKPKVEMSYIGG